MKKILFLTLYFFSVLVNASTNVTVVWPFSSSSAHANMTRMLIDNANKIQNKYEFRIEFKPGAGGLIATNYVKNSDDKNIRILSTTSSFYTRKILHDDKTYDIEDFYPLVFHCYKEPMVLYSLKHSNILDLKKNTQYSIGINTGSITSALAREIAKELNFNFNLIPYPGAIEVLRDVQGGHLELGIGFPASVKTYPNLNILYNTTEKINSNLSFFTGTYMLLLPSNQTNQIKTELSNIFTLAASSTEVSTICNDLLGINPKFSEKEKNKYYYWMHDSWKKIKNN
jgi:hypothetical protein